MLREKQRLDWFLSTLAAFGSFGFFFSVVAYGWYKAFLVMAV